MNIYYTKNNTHIENSYEVINTQLMEEYIKWIIEERKARKYHIRSLKSYKREWLGHNRLYYLHLFRNHTKDVDLEEPSKWYLEIIWLILGGI